MDNLTHTLFGATLARTPLGRAGRGTLPALIIASNAPDVDIIAALGGGTKTYLAWHRGPTHGPLGVIGLGLATAAVVWIGRAAIDRRGRDRKTDVSSSSDAGFAMLACLSMIGVVLHVLMDLPTSYGTRILSPFSWRWFAFDWLPIVDIYLMMALVAGLIIGELTKTSQRRLAAIVLAVMAANYGLRAVAHAQAVTLAPRLFGQRFGQPCDPGAATVERALAAWPRADRSATSAPGRTCLVELAAVPTFISPFRWRVIAQLSNGYELHDIDVLDLRAHSEFTGSGSFWRRTVRYPNQWTPPTFVAATAPAAAVFLGFSRFPAARTFAEPSGTTIVRWTDMRFVAGPSARDEPRPPNIFNVVVQVDPSGRIVREEIGK
jgi:inner membrane protein